MILKKIFSYIALLLIFFGVLTIFLEASSKNISAGIILITGLFITFLVIGKIFIKSTIPRLRKFSSFLYSLSLIVGIVFVLGFTIMAAQNFLSLKRAEKLINNINQYKQEGGHFPLTLEELKPDFYVNLPRFYTGLKASDFTYKAGSRQDNIDKDIIEPNNYYILTYRSSFGNEYRYASHAERWESYAGTEEIKIRQLHLTEPLAGFFISSRFEVSNKK